MNITIITVLIWLASIITTSLCFVIFLGSKNLSSRIFAHSILWVSVWIFCVGVFSASSSHETALFFARLTYYQGTVLAAFFLVFLIVYPDNKAPNPWLTVLLVAYESLLGIIFFHSDLIITSVWRIEAPHQWAWSFGQLSYIFELSFFGFFGTGIYILYKKIHASSFERDRTNLKFMFWSIIVGAIPPSVMCILLPRFGYFSLNWLGPVTEVLWIPIISYSIIRYNQMNVRAVFTEVLAVAMAAIFFLNIFIDIPFGIWARVLTFIIYLILAYFLIKGVLREAVHRDELNNLNQTLTDRVAAQTIELRKSYESEKHARMELEKLNDAKDQFIMITQHHLRTPVTSILWALESSLKGTYGKVESELKEVLLETQRSAKRLMGIVNDFLNITAIKIGTSILNLNNRSLLPAVSDILDELKPDIEHLKLNIKYDKNGKWPILRIDFDKLRESLLIVIENAVKYNKPSGYINIETQTKDGSFILTIENTGIGIDPSESEKIGSSLFFRGIEARKNNPIGMGIGLSVVKAIIKAHHGSFSIQSKGRGMGATVKILLPLTQ